MSSFVKRTKETLPSARSGHVLLNDNKNQCIYVLGGYNDNGPLDDIYRYDYKINKWTKLITTSSSKIIATPLPRLECDCCLISAGDNTNIYLFGGIQNISDIRDKTDIRDITLGLDFISQLHPVDYKWNCRSDYIVPTGETEIANGIRVPIMQELPNDGSKTRTRYHHGLIAQEVKQVMDANSVDFGGFQDHSIKGGQEQLTIAYTELIAPMIKAIQELKAEVDVLKQRITELENK